MPVSKKPRTLGKPHSDLGFLSLNNTIRNLRTILENHQTGWMTQMRDSKKREQIQKSRVSLPPYVLLWLGLSLVVALLYNGVQLHQAFSGNYVVADDARQHIFWMRRFSDPQLFPHDLIADYFQSVAPWGYANFYRLLATAGLDPLLVSKLVPPILGLIATGYGFFLCLELLPMPFAGFLSAWMINQTLWGHDDLASGTARAFMPAIFLAFLYYLTRRSLLPCLVTILLEGLFYPQYVFVFAIILLLQLITWQEGKLRLSGDRRDYWLCFAGLGVTFLVLLPFALATSTYGPTITAAEAKQIPEFYIEGRGRFFVSDPWLYWLSGSRSGVFPTFKPPLMGLGLLLPLVLRSPIRFPLVQQVSDRIRILVDIAVAAFVMFFAAHACLFKLHLPSRYTGYTLRFVLILATAILLTLLLHSGLNRLQQPSRSRAQILIVGSGSLLVAMALLLYPYYISDAILFSYKNGDEPELYQFFAQKPKDIVVASLSSEVNNLPIFARRSILVGREYAIPYHVGYANQFRQRSIDLIHAQYTLDKAELAQFIRKYDIDFWLLDADSFNRDTPEGYRIKQYPDALSQVLEHLRQGNPTLKRLARRCTEFEQHGLRAIGADCLLRAIK
jgi:hypothetical protein